jgi:predicted ATPase
VSERKTRRTASVRRTTLAEETEYVFQHALVQDTIYESILQKTRKEQHAKAAQAIETLFADRLPDFYGMLAYHFSRAEHLEKAEDTSSRRATTRARGGVERGARLLPRGVEDILPHQRRGRRPEEVAAREEDRPRAAQHG